MLEGIRTYLRHAWIAVVGCAASLCFAAPAVAGSLGAVDTYETGGFVLGTGIADFDRDGNRDLIVSNDEGAKGDHLSFLRGKGDGTFRKPRDIRDPRGPQGIVVARLNRDKLPDFAVADYDKSVVSIFINSGDGKFKPARKLDGGPGNWLLETADLNDDGRPDLVAGNYDSGDGGDALSVFLGDVHGTFKPRQDYFAVPSMSGLALGHILGDAAIDAVTVDIAGELFTARGDGSGGFVEPIDPPGDYTDASLGWQAVLGQFNAVSGPDLAIPLYSTDQVSVLPGGGTQGFTGPPYLTPAGDGANGIAAGDFNRDGDLDVVSGSYFNAGVKVLFGAGTGTFDCSEPAPGSAGVQTIEVGKLNGDKRLDVVAGTDSGIDVFLGKPSTC